MGLSIIRSSLTSQPFVDIYAKYGSVFSAASKFPKGRILPTDVLGRGVPVKSLTRDSP